MKKLISRNPADNSIIGEVTVSTATEIADNVKQAHAAKLPWKLVGLKKRVEILRPLIAALSNKEKEITSLITREIGKPITEARSEFESVIVYLQHFLDEDSKYLEDEITFREGNAVHRIVYEPRGVVASIVPWNFPLSNFIWGVIPNLIAGNTVVFKHSEECPLLSKLVEEIILQLKNLPAGVFSAVYGGPDVGNILANQDIDMMWFTGSSATGKKLYEIAGKKQIKAILEMGGSNPALVFEDVDVDRVAEKILESRFLNCGQVCDSIKRVIVHRSCYQPLIEKLTALVKNIKLGDPQLENTQLGSLAAMRQLELLETQVNASVREGATVIIGGQRPAHLSGAYYLPTILTNILPTMRVWREEVFGPVLPIVPFDTEEEAITLANDTPYGLGATIFSNDLNRAQRVAAQTDAACLDINEGSHWLPRNPFGGFKASGMACEHGRLGFQELCRFKVIAE